MRRNHLLLCAFCIVFFFLPFGPLTAQSSDGSSGTSVKKTDSMPALHSIALDAFRNDKTEKGKRAVEKIIGTVNRVAEDARLKEVMGEDRDQVGALARLLVKEKEQNALARRYVKAFLTSGELYKYLLRTDKFTRAVKKAYDGRREALFDIARSMREYGLAFQLMDRGTMLEIIRKRLQENESDVQDVRLLAWMTTRISPWHGDEVSTERLTQYRDLLKKGLEQYSDETVLRWRLGDVYYLMGEYDRAAERYREVMNSSFGKEKNKIKDNSMFSLDLNEFKKRKDPLRYNSLPYLKLAASLHKAGRDEEAKQVLMRQLEEPDPMYETQTRLAVIIGLWRSGMQADAVSMLRERFSTFLNSSKQELKNSWLELRWVAFRLYKYLRIMDRPVEALLVGKETLRMTKNFGRGRPMRNLRERTQKQMMSLRRQVPQKIKREFEKKFLNRSQPDPDEETRRKVRKLVNRLGARSYKKRLDAYENLKEIGLSAVPVLRKHRNHDNPEVRISIEKLINLFVLKHRMKILRKKYGIQQK